jgi:hypothetical protein
MKTTRFRRIVLAAAVACLALAATHGKADEGMWLFNHLPLKLLKDKYNFTPTKDWLTHVQQSSVRFNSGGSGSFVSEDGLVITNHHVGLDTLQQISTKEKDYVKDGFQAKTRDQEVKAIEAELNVLLSIQDVTERVNAAVTADMPAEKAFAARRAIMAKIEEEALGKQDPKKFRYDIVTLYQGGEYHLYGYHKYTDVRLVFAPEQQIAFYGGDPDNFEYPRYDLDICIFRVYEDGKPVKPQHYLKWSKAGAKDNELVFVSGHPGRTDRLNTVADLKYLRDLQYPSALQFLNRLEVMLAAYSARTTENARVAKEDFFSIQNSRKARIGGLEGLLDPHMMAKKEADEKKLRDAVAKDPKLQYAASAWDRIEKAQKEIADVALRYNVLEGRRGFNSKYFVTARTLARAAVERPKPNSDRLREFRQSNEESLKEQLFSDEPIYDEFETVKLADSLTYLSSQLGADNPLVQKVLAGKAPVLRAKELVKGTTLRAPKKDKAGKPIGPDIRKELYEGGAKLVDASKDPMIALAKLVDDDARAVRKVVETQNEVKQQAYAQIGKARFAVEGSGTYPDATFTLRLSVGVVKGYVEDGKKVPFETDFTGMYARSKDHDNKEPFDLPERWLKAKDKLNLKTPFNFVSTNDIIGGNSGSPVINKEGEFVGIIFDGNIQSLVLDFVFDEVIARAVSVHSSGIIEALRKVYGADSLADELTGAKK